MEIRELSGNKSGTIDSYRSGNKHLFLIRREKQ
jgi:hypothetical protein